MYLENKTVDQDRMLQLFGYALKVLDHLSVKILCLFSVYSTFYFLYVLKFIVFSGMAALVIRSTTSFQTEISQQLSDGLK